MESILEYLSKDSDKKNINDLTDLWMDISDSNIGVIFLREHHGWKCISHIEDIFATLNQPKNFRKQLKPISLKEEISNEIDEKYQSEYVTKLKFKKVMVIPILYEADRIGIIYMGNRKSKYPQNLLASLEPLKGLTQIILYKLKLAEQLTYLNSDNRYFSDK